MVKLISPKKFANKFILLRFGKKHYTHKSYRNEWVRRFEEYGSNPPQADSESKRVIERLSKKYKITHGSY